PSSRAVGAWYRATRMGRSAGGTRWRVAPSADIPRSQPGGPPPSPSAPTAARWPAATTGRSSAGTWRGGGASARPCPTPRPPARTVAFLGDGRRLLVATRDGQVRVWDLASLRVYPLPPEGVAVTSLAVSRNGDCFASGTEGGTVRVWDATTLRQSGPTFKLTRAVPC